MALEKTIRKFTLLRKERKHTHDIISFFFHYSGHGGRVKDSNGDEDDGFDETIYPVDHDRYQGDSGQIVDDVRLYHLHFPC